MREIQPAANLDGDELLRSETNGDSFTFEATFVSTDVTDADFELPYDILEIPDLGDFEIPES